MTESKKTKTHTKDTTASAHHTVETPIVETPTGEKPEAHYELHLSPANHEHHERVSHTRSEAQCASTNKSFAARQNTIKDTPPVKSHFAKDSFYRNAAATNAKPQSKNANRIWRFLEWLATSALIFIVLFFTINFSAYFELFKEKLDSLRGTYGLSPYIENMMTDGQSKTQELLPLTATVDQNKKQIPYIAVDIAPPDDRIIIPRIGKNIPIVNVKTENLIKRDWNALEKDMQEALQQGVVHYPGTAEPGDHGNVVITGHSSYFLWDPGQFKDVFALLHQVVEGDTIIVYHNQIKYTYKVYQKEVVTPDKVSVLAQEGGDRLTLITCTPVGTNLKRLVVFAKPV